MNITGVYPRKMKITSIDESALDHVFVDKLKSLQSAKERAIEVEDYDRAKKIKEVMDKIKVTGSKI
jgi:hypothetical protein